MAKKNNFTMEFAIKLWMMFFMIVMSSGTTTTVSPAPQDVPTSASSSTGDPEDSGVRPIEQSMSLIYIMTNFFLEVILNPKSITEIANKTDFGNFSQVSKSLQEDWQMWVSHYYYYVICIVLAIIYALGLPIAGLVVCCCRRRGRCGGNSSPFEHQYTKHKRRACAVILGLLMAFVLLGTTASFIANMLIFEQTSNRLPNTIVSTLRSVENHHSLSLQQLDDTFSNEFLSDTRALATQVRTFPNGVQSVVGDSTGCGPLLQSAQSFFDLGNETIKALNEIDIITKNLSSVTKELEVALTNLRTKMLGDFNPCTANPYCKKMLDIANKPLNTVAKYELLKDTMGTHVSKIGAVYMAGVLQHLSEVYSEYNKISEAVEPSTMNTTQALEDDTQNMANGVIGFADTAAKQLRQFSISQLITQTNVSITPWIVKVGDYRYYAGIGLSSLALLFVTLISVGLLIGACGERAREDANTCNRQKGACLLMTASGLIFGLAWLLMLGTCALLLIGGIAHNDICRHMVDMEDGAALDVISKMFVDNFNISMYSKDDSLFTLHSRCKEDQGIYTAAHMDTISPDLNITRVLDQNQYFIGSHIASLRKATYDIDPINLTQPDFLNSLSDLQAFVKSVESSFNMTEFLNKLTDCQSKITPMQLAQDSRTLVDEIENRYSSLAPTYDDRVRNQIGKCGSVFEAVDEIIKSTCVNFLYPFNAYWFSLGWCLFFYIPTIAISMVLVSIYRKTDKFELLNEESFHDPQNSQTWSTDGGPHGSRDADYNTRPLPDTPRQSYYGPPRGLPRSRPANEHLSEPSYRDVMYDGASRGYSIERNQRDTYYPPDRRDYGRDNSGFHRY